jgi:hypothetical protein
MGYELFAREKFAHVLDSDGRSILEMLELHRASIPLFLQGLDISKGDFPDALNVW